nr:MAG TPA: Protein of unknown function (DUF1642) [Caudoviricetes sp.]
MNKQELIKRIEDLPYKEGLIVDKIDISRKGLLELVSQLDEPGKVQIPQSVADWIKKCKTFKSFAVSLSFALQPSVWEVNGLSGECIEWLTDTENQETFARAWIDGYKIQETRYVVTDGNHLYFKKYQEDIEIVILVDEQPGTMEYVKKFDTKEEAQKAADILGWKVQEVEE